MTRSGSEDSGALCPGPAVSSTALTYTTNEPSSLLCVVPEPSTLGDGCAVIARGAEERELSAAGSTNGGERKKTYCALSLDACQIGDDEDRSSAAESDAASIWEGRTRGFRATQFRSSGGACVVTVVNGGRASERAADEPQV